MHGETSKLNTIYGPDTFVREEKQAIFILLDNVLIRPERSPED